MSIYEDPLHYYHVDAPSIVSTVLGWDNGKFKKRASQIERMYEAPSIEQLAILKEYANQSQEEQEQCRLKSGKLQLVRERHVETDVTLESQGQSIATTILAASPTPSELSPEKHTIAME